MRLPSKSRGTSSAPLGWAAVISCPSSRTRRAIVASSKTMRSSSRPPVCLKLAALGNIQPHRRGSWLREVVGTPADSGDPENGFAARHYRVRRPVAARHARFHQQPAQRPPSHAAQRDEAIAATRAPHFPARAPRAPRAPLPAGYQGVPAGPLEPRRRSAGAPCHLEVAEHGTTPLPRGDDLLRCTADLPRHAEPLERDFSSPSSPERQSAARRSASQLHQLPRGPDPEHQRSEEHTSELQSLAYLVCRLLLEKK